ncbi:TPA: hypothetical protein UDO34_001163 [Streptococcus suis]|nr:hypothetical protein [Streptococcus suis]
MIDAISLLTIYNSSQIEFSFAQDKSLSQIEFFFAQDWRLSQIEFSFAQDWRLSQIPSFQSVLCNLDNNLF